MPFYCLLACQDTVGGNVLATTTHLGDRPKVNDLIGAIKIMLDAYNEEKIDRLLIAHNEFVSTMSQKPDMKTLLPVSSIDENDKSLQTHWDYIYEPDAIDLLDGVLMRYIESQVYRGATENFACDRFTHGGIILIFNLLIISSL